MKASKFALGTAVLVLLSVSAWAGDKMKVNIQIDHTVRVGSTQLDPGQYKMTWTENGSSADVTFSQGKKVIATVTARVTQAHSGYDAPAITFGNSGSTLAEVALPEVSLSFTNNNAGSASPGH